MADGTSTRRVIDHLIIQLTYPEFHIETETEVGSLTGLQ